MRNFLFLPSNSIFMTIAISISATSIHQGDLMTTSVVTLVGCAIQSIFQPKPTKGDEQ